MQTVSSARTDSALASTEPVFLFTDSGVDDALAILVLRGAGVRIAGVCAVTGNVSARQGALNLAYLLDLLRVKWPVFVLEDGRYPRRDSPHGPVGLGALTPVSSPELEIVSLDAALPLLRQPLHILSLSPLSGLAWLLHRKGELGGLPATVVGGIYRPEAASPASEFNVSADAEAASFVFSSAPSLQLVPLDVTRQVVLEANELAIIHSAGSAGHAFLRRLLGPYFDHHERTYGFRGCYLHDPTGVAALLWPYLFKFLAVSGTVDTSLGSTHGMTRFEVFDHAVGAHSRAPLPALNLAVDCDAREVKRRLLQCMRAGLDGARGLASA